MRNDGVVFDARDAELLALRVAKRSKLSGPNIGDFLKGPDGALLRFTHDWGDDIQTAPARSGSYHLGSNGHADYSGGLDPAIPKSSFRLISFELKMGGFWFFHHNFASAANGVDCEAPCKVFELID